ncbi:hypothetical protein ACS5NL_07585 [Hydrogenophaga sp. MI9]
MLAGLWCAAPGVAEAGVEAMGLSNSLLQAADASAVKTGLTEHQVRQLVAADPIDREALLVTLVGQIEAHLRRQPGRPLSPIPAAVLKGWLRTLLDRQLSPAEWVERLDLLTKIHGELDQRFSALVSGRVGVDDGLIRANAARASGDFGTALTLLDGWVQQVAAASAAASSDRNAAADRMLSSLLAVRGLLKALQLDADAAVQDLMRAAGVLGDAETDKPLLLLLSGSVAATEGAKGRFTDVARSIKEQSEAALARRSSDPAWRRTLWVAHLWMASAAFDRGDLVAARDGFVEASRVMPQLSGDDDLSLVAAWMREFLPGALPADGASADLRAHQVAAVRLARDLTRRRPQWTQAWFLLALSDLVQGVTDIQRGAPEPGRAALQEAVRALDRLDAADAGNSKALQIRLQVELFLVSERLVAKAQEEALSLLGRAVAAEAELRRRGEDLSDLEPLMFSVKLQVARLHGQRGARAQQLSVLTEALALAERHDDRGAVWELGGWRVHVELAEALEADGQLPRSLQHRQLAQAKTEAAVRRAGERPEWVEREWENLHEMAQIQGALQSADEAGRTNARALELARRESTATPADSDWHRRLFRSLWADAAILKQRGVDGAVLPRQEEAADVAADRYAANPKAEFAAEDLWLAKSTTCGGWARTVRLDLADGACRRALSVAEQALRAEPASDKWLDYAATSHSESADLADVRKDFPRALEHRQAAVDQSARRSATAREGSSAGMAHWLRLFHLGRAQMQLKKNAEALVAMAQARELAQRFSSQLPADDLWCEYRWFSEGGWAGLQMEAGGLPEAAKALAAAAAAADTLANRSTSARTLWWARAAESYEMLDKALSEQGLETEARQASAKAITYRARLHEQRRLAGARETAREQLGRVLADLGIGQEQADGLSKQGLIERLQKRLDERYGVAREQGMNRERSDQIQLLQNALFAVRQLPD